MADVQGRSHISYATVTTGTAAYASGDVIGGTITFSDLKYIHSRGMITDATVITQSGGSLALTLMFFNNAPTTAADNGAATFAVTDLSAKYVGALSVTTSDYVLAGTAGTPPCAATITGKAITYKLSDGGNLFCVPVARAAHTFASTSDLIIKLGVLQD